MKFCTHWDVNEKNRVPERVVFVRRALTLTALLTGAAHTQTLTATISGTHHDAAGLTATADLLGVPSTPVTLGARYDLTFNPRIANPPSHALTAVLTGAPTTKDGWRARPYLALGAGTATTATGALGLQALAIVGVTNVRDTAGPLTYGLTLESRINARGMGLFAGLSVQYDLGGRR